MFKILASMNQYLKESEFSFFGIGKKRKLGPRNFPNVLKT